VIDPQTVHRVPVPALAPVDAVATFAEVSLGYTPDEAMREARRAAGTGVLG
jgi:hypothetical protein